MFGNESGVDMIFILLIYRFIYWEKFIGFRYFKDVLLYKIFILWWIFLIDFYGSCWNYIDCKNCFKRWFYNLM